MPVAIQATDLPWGVRCRRDDDPVVVVTFFFAWIVVCFVLGMATVLVSPPRIVVNSGGIKATADDIAITSLACFPINDATVVDKTEDDATAAAAESTGSEDIVSA